MSTRSDDDEVEILFDDGSAAGDDGDDSSSHVSSVGICYPDDGDDSPQVIAFWDVENCDELPDDEEEDVKRALTPQELLQEGLKFASPPPEMPIYRPCYAPERGLVRNLIRGSIAFTALYVIVVLCIMPKPKNSSSTSSSGFYHCKGTEIMSPSNEPFHAKGIVLSGWLVPDADELRLNDVHPRDLNTPSDIRRNIERILKNAEDAETFWKAFHDNYVTANDIASFAQQGFNAVRVPFNYRLLSPQESPGEYSEQGFIVLDKVIQWCKENDLAVLLDMHACPGGQSHDHHADPEHHYWYQDPERNNQWIEKGVQVLWEENSDYTELTGRSPEFNRQRTAELWRKIAARYKDETAILGYELANEPYFYEASGFTNDDLRQFFMDVTQEVRGVDTNHIVFVEGNIFAEMIDGLLPPWDDNMAIAFHRYSRETGYRDGKVQEYLDARAKHQVPFLLTESGENSNPWIYEMKNLMEENGIGWFYKGFKKVRSITASHSVAITPNYQYVINNWRDSPDIDPNRAKKGLMELAEGLKTENCQVQPGLFDAMLDPTFSSSSKPFTELAVPGTVHTVDFDAGNQGIAYSDSRYKKEKDMGAPWNGGSLYRNDGVDIYPSGDDHESWSNGYHVSDTEDGEWLKYTVTVKKTAFYRASLRVRRSLQSTETGEIQLLDGAVVLADGIQIAGSDESSSSWQTQTLYDAFRLAKGTHTLELKIVKGGFDIAWMHFEQV